MFQIFVKWRIRPTPVGDETPTKLASQGFHPLKREYVFSFFNSTITTQINHQSYNPRPKIEVCIVYASLTRLAFTDNDRTSPAIHQLATSRLLQNATHGLQKLAHRPTRPDFPHHWPLEDWITTNWSYDIPTHTRVSAQKEKIRLISPIKRHGL